MAVAYARLMAMKHYAFRALDYVQAAHADDRRHLLFNAVQKARVSTEGVKVMTMLSECIGGRGVESDTYFEMAMRDAQLIPGLEGSTHINFGLTAQFINTYFADGDDAHRPALPPYGADVGENPYLMESGDRNAKSVRFADCLQPYSPLESHQNVAVFAEQITAFRRFVTEDVASHTQTEDATGLRIALGKCFSTIVYAQLIAERCAAMPASPSMISVIFHALIEDMSGEAQRLAALFPPDSDQRAHLERIITVPRTDAADIEAVADAIAARYEAE
jgi:acyl-CoA dehydrogenase